MSKRKMPAALARYWKTHKRKGSKTTTKRRRRASGHTAHAHKAHHRRCSHGDAQQVVTGVRGVLWCGQCGALCDGQRWHRPHR